MEIGRIGQDGEIRHTPCRFSGQPPKSAPDPREVANHLYNSDYGQILGTDDRLDARCTQLRSGAAEKLAVRPAAAQFADQFGGVEVARGFSGGNQDRAWR
jgi:hypothetical protein